MNVLYMAPRYHTNQVPIIKGWLAAGDKVKFISQYKGKTEDYSQIEPDVLGYSLLFKGVNWIYKYVLNRKIMHSANVFAFEMKYGIPPIFLLHQKLKEFKPDIAILRERSIYNIVAYFLCKVNHIPTILYNQTPLFKEEPIKNDIFHKIVRKMTPAKRMTPVMGRKTEKSYQEKNSFFVPFVAEPMLVPMAKHYFKEGKINLLCVAKYETRKNILMLLEIVNELRKETKITVTIVGEVSTEHHKKYYEKVKNYVLNNKMQKMITLKVNVSMEEVRREYANADVFVLPSTKEVASISQLEAMAFCLPIICSDTNGAACYIEDEKNGILFRDNDKNDLEEKIIRIVKDREGIKRMGAYSYEKVTKHYSFENYKQKVQELL